MLEKSFSWAANFHKTWLVELAQNSCERLRNCGTKPRWSPMSSVIRPTVFIVSCFPIIIIRKQFWVLSFNIWLYCGNIRDIVISGFSSILQYPLHETILHGGQYISFLYCVLHCSTKSCVSSTDFSLRLVAVVQYLIHMAPSLVHYFHCTFYTFSSILHCIECLGFYIINMQWYAMTTKEPYNCTFTRKVNAKEASEAESSA